MKVRITDLLDSYLDESVRLTPPGAQQTDDPAAAPEADKETIELKESKHRFGWKEILAVAAALALIVLGGFGLKHLLTRETGKNQATDGPDEPSTVLMSDPRNSEPVSETVETSLVKEPAETDSVPTDTHDVIWSEAIVYVFTDRELHDLNEVLTARAKQEDAAYGNSCFVLVESSTSVGTKGLDREPESLSEGIRIGVHFEIWDAGKELQENELHYLMSMTQAQAAALQEREDGMERIADGQAEVDCSAEGYEVNSIQITKPAAPLRSWTGEELTPELRKAANRFLTYFAEQGITELYAETAGAYQLVSFAHLYYKINEPDAITYQSLDGNSYETLTKEQVDLLLQSKMVVTPPTVPDPTDFTAERGDNYAVHEMYRDGVYWFPAADGDMHTQFALVERMTENSSGNWSLEFRVYDLVRSPEEWDVDDIQAVLSALTVQEAEQDERFVLTMTGTANVLFYDSSEPQFYLYSLDVIWIPASPEDEELNSSVQEAVNAQLSRFAELDVRDLNEMKAEEGALLRYALHLAKQDRSDDRFPITVQTRNGAEYLTMKLSDVNWLLSELLLNAKVDPEEGAAFSCPLQSDPGAKGFVENGVVWFPSGEDLAYPNFVVCDGGHLAAYEVTWADGTITETECLYVSFCVYEASLEDYSLKLTDYWKLSAAEAAVLAKDKTIYLVEKGTAIILPAGGGQVLDYHVTWVEPEGWEEEFPQEYPITDWRIEGEGFLQSGEINLYRYEQLHEAEGYVDILTRLAREALNAPDASFAPDSQHDGYANWFLSAGSNGSASISGSDITGRFTYSIYPTFAQILEQSQAEITDRAAMEAAARAFAEAFSGITGPLELADFRDEVQSYHDERFTGMRDISVPAVIYYFRSAEFSRVSLPLQEGLETPVICGDSTLDDLTDHVFAVCVWPDGTVLRANNYITKAQIVSDGSIQIWDERSLPTIASFLTSYTENDTLIVESAGVEFCSVYFGYAEIYPILTVRYHFASAPEEHRSTEIVFSGLLD